MQHEQPQAGSSLLELLVVMALISIMATISFNSVIRGARRTALRAATVNLERIMMRVQYDAYGHSRMRGLRFSQTLSGWQYAVYEDGDGDGVLNADIVAGTDLLVEGPFPLADRISMATIGAPMPPVKHPDTGSTVEPDMKAINFNQSSICSFAPNGDATPGTIYLVNGNSGEAAMVRSSGQGGRIRALFYGLRGQDWEP